MLTLNNIKNYHIFFIQLKFILVVEALEEVALVAILYLASFLLKMVLVEVLNLVLFHLLPKEFKNLLILVAYFVCLQLVD